MVYSLELYVCVTFAEPPTPPFDPLFVRIPSKRWVMSPIVRLSSTQGKSDIATNVLVEIDDCIGGTSKNWALNRLPPSPSLAPPHAPPLSPRALLRRLDGVMGAPRLPRTLSRLSSQLFGAPFHLAYGFLHMDDGLRVRVVDA